MTSETPVFIPFREERLAAVITEPDSHPRALILLLQGLGSPRSHRNQLWTRIARALAAEGFASVRLDWPEVGDSTGSFPAELDSPPAEEAIAVTQMALDALGLDRVGIIGNCLGARTALVVASRLEACTSIACIVEGSPASLLRGEGKTAPHRAAKRMAGHVPRLAKKVRRILRTRRIQPRMRFVPEVSSALRAADLMFLFLGSETAARRLERSIAGLAGTADAHGRAEVRLIPTGAAFGMRLSVDLQPTVIDALIEWMDESFSLAPVGEDHAVGRLGVDRTVPVHAEDRGPVAAAQRPDVGKEP